MSRNVLLFILNAILVLPLSGQEKYDLQYRFDAGQKQIYTIGLNSLDTQKFESYPPQEISSIMEMKISLAADTTRKTEELSLTATFEKVNVTTRMGGQTFYPETGVLIGKSATLLSGKKGKDTQLIDREFLPRIQIVPTDPSGQNLGDFLKQLLHPLPEQPVGKGDTWELTITDTTEDLGREAITVAKGSFQLKNIREKDGIKVAEVSGKLKMTALVKGDVQGGKFDYQGEGSGKLDYVWDLEKNRMVEKKLRIVIDGVFKLTGMMSGTGTLSSDSDYTFRLEKE